MFCQNESARIGACIASIAAAVRGRRACVTILVNGSTDGSARLALEALRAARLDARVFTIAHADKSNAINRSLYELRQRAGLEVFLDGYSIIDPRSVAALEHALAETPFASAATGIAGVGRTMTRATAETMVGGVLHGQLHALRSAFLDRLVSAGLRLPIGLYRGDGLLGSMVCHDLDPVANPWDDLRIKGAAEAIYRIPRLSPFRPADVARQYRRKIRQMRGTLETEAIKAIVNALGYQALPRYADDMIADWLAHHPIPPTPLLDRPFMTLALRHHARARHPSEDALRPVLAGQTDRSL